MKQRAGTAAAIISLLLVATTVAAISAFFFLVYSPSPNHGSTTTITDEAVVTSDSSTYFPDGYYSRLVNFSLTRSGDLTVVGNASFLYVIPTSLETRTITVGPGGSTTV